MSQEGGGGEKSSLEIKKEKMDAPDSATAPKPAGSAPSAPATAAAAPGRRFMPNIGVERTRREM